MLAFAMRILPPLPALALAVVLLEAPVLAEDAPPSSRLEGVGRALEGARNRSEELTRQAEKLRGEVAAMTREAIAAAARAQELESTLGAFEVALAVLRVERARKSAALESRHGQLWQTLAALQRIALQPPQTLLLEPVEPLDRLRGALLLRSAVPLLEVRATTLRDELAQLAALSSEIDIRREELRDSLGALAEERRAMEALLQQKQALVGKTEEAQGALEARLRQLASEAGSLRELLVKLEEAKREEEEREAERQERIAQAARERTAAERTAAERAAAERAAAERAATESAGAERAGAAERPGGTEAGAAAAGEEPLGSQLARLARPQELRAFPDSPGGLALPARGPVVVRFGDKSPRVQEETAKGIVIETRPGATVVAPYDGRVVYAGTFRRYGLILIIEHDGRYHSLLAGFDRLNATLGQWLLAGEPVGVMQAAGDRKPELYLELRQSGLPVDPLPWLAGSNGDKARG